MKPQVYLDGAELARLEDWAADRGWTKPQAIRAAVRALTAIPGDDPILTDAVSFAVMSARRCRTALTFHADFARAGFEVRGADG